MRKSTRALGIVLGATILIAAIPSLAGAAAQLSEVLVKNTTADPVPTRAVGPTEVAGNVAVSNLPSTQQVAGAVSVSNLPAIQQVAGTVSQAARTVGLLETRIDPGVNRFFHVAEFKLVRLILSLSCAGNANIPVFTGGGRTRLDTVAVSPAPEHRVYEIPGTSMSVTNTASCPLYITAYGRPN